MSTFLNGQSGNITIGTSSLVVEGWTISINGEALDVTNTGSGGWAENITGIKDAEITAKTFWDSAAMPTSSPYSLQPGNTATMVLAIGASAKSFSVPARITNIKVENPAKGVIPFEVTAKSNGAVTFPT